NASTRSFLCSPTGPNGAEMCAHREIARQDVSRPAGRPFSFFESHIDMKTKRLHLIWSLLGAMSFAAGCEEPPAAAPAPLPKVTVMHPEQRDLTDHEEFNGWMAPDKTVDVRARVRGHIIKVDFTDGQYVNKGDLLFE